MEFGPLLTARRERLHAVQAQLKITATDAREAIADCFCITRFNYVQQHADRVGLDTDEAQLTATMARLYRKAFARLGLEYAQPTVAGLQVVQHLLHQDLAWRTIDPALQASHAEVCTALLARVPAE